MSDRFWVGNSGNWSDFLNHWSASSGGAPNASLPTSDDNAFFDALSFTLAAQTVTLDATTNCKAMNWTGATNGPTLAFGAFYIRSYGSATSIAAMTLTGAGGQLRFNGAGATVSTLTTAGQTIPCQLHNIGTGTLSLQDNLTVSVLIGVSAGTFLTNGFTVTIPRWDIAGATAKTITLGSSIVNITGAEGWNYTGSALTLTANTAVFKFTGTAAFVGGDITTYNEVQLNGTAHTITGSNTFTFLKFGPAGAQTITFTDGTTQTVLNPPTRTGTGQIIFQGSGAGGWGITEQGQQRVILSNMSISFSTALPRDTWFASPPSTDGGNNFNWIFQSPPMGGGWWVLRH